MSMWKNWIFDMDGTLTVPKHDFAQIRSLLSIPSEGDILTHIASLPLEEQKKSHALLYQWEYDIALQGEASEDAKDLLEYLSEQDCRLGILTRNKKELARITLEAAGLIDYFSLDVILGRDCALPKPNPEGIHYICSQWKVAPKDVVMVGDYIYDIEAGQRAGTSTIHIVREEDSMCISAASKNADYVCRTLRSFIWT